MAQKARQVKKARTTSNDRTTTVIANKQAWAPRSRDGIKTTPSKPNKRSQNKNQRKSISKAQANTRMFKIKKLHLPAHFYNVIAVALVLTVLLIPIPTLQGKVNAPVQSNAAKNPAWCNDCRARAISIPSINFVDNDIAQMQFNTNEKTWPTPLSGLGTPKESIANNIIIFGHSKWFGNVNPYAVISRIKLGDDIFVTDQLGNTMNFTVSHLRLVDRQNGEPVHPKDELQLTLLTSARYNGEWLLPTTVDSATEDTVTDNQAYAIFVITAKPKSQ